MLVGILIIVAVWTDDYRKDTIIEPFSFLLLELWMENILVVLIDR